MEQMRIKDATAINILKSMMSMQTGLWEKEALKRAIEVLEEINEQKTEEQRAEDS